MDVQIQMDDFVAGDPARIGNVYPVKGGRGLREKHLQILIAITEPKPCNGCVGLLLVIDKNGKPVGVNSYGLHYLEDLVPVAFADGVEDWSVPVRSL